MSGQVHFTCPLGYHDTLLTFWPLLTQTTDEQLNDTYDCLCNISRESDDYAHWNVLYIFWPCTTACLFLSHNKSYYITNPQLTALNMLSLVFCNV